MSPVIPASLHLGPGTRRSRESGPAGARYSPGRQEGSGCLALPPWRIDSGTVNQQKGTVVLEPDHYPAEDRAKDAIGSSTGQDLGDELRRQAEALAYKAAQDYELALRRVESGLVAAATRGDGFSESVRNLAVDIVRTHMWRGLMRAQLEAGTSSTFWVQR